MGGKLEAAAPSSAAIYLMTPRRRRRGRPTPTADPIEAIDDNISERTGYRALPVVPHSVFVPAFIVRPRAGFVNRYAARTESHSPRPYSTPGSHWSIGESVVVEIPTPMALRVASQLGSRHERRRLIAWTGPSGVLSLQNV